MSRIVGHGRPFGALAALALGLTGLLAGCVDVPQETFRSYVTPVYVLDLVDPQIPTPIDIEGVTYDPETGVEVPVPPDASPAYAALLQGFVNTLDGWALNSTVEFQFSGPVRLETVNADTVVLVDLSADPPRRLTGLGPVAAFDESTGRTDVVIASPTPLPAGRTLGVVVRGNGPSGVLDASGDPVATPITFTFLKSREPLLRRIERSDGSVRIVSNIVASADTPEDAAALQLLEGMRAAYAPALDALAAGAVDGLAAIPREEVVLFWTFTTQSATIAQFDPLFSVIPTPNDLLFAGDTLSFPIAADDPAAQRALFGWLNTLDGFSLLSAPEVSFSGAIDPATLDVDSVRVFDLTTPAALSEVTALARTWDPQTNTLVLQQETPGAVFEHGHRYAVVVLSGPSEAGGVATGVLDAAGAPITRSQAMALALLTEPLVEGDRSLLPVLTDAQAQQFEAVRAGYAQVTGALAAQLDIDRDRIASLWTFTIGTQAESVVDPSLGVVPTPNDLVLLPDTIQGLIARAQSPAEAAFFTWLSEQGGWSGVISGGAAFSAPLDPTTVPVAFHVFRISVRLDPVDDLVIDAPLPGVPSSEIAFHRATPWVPGTTYFAIVTDDLRTADGAPLLPSSFEVLVRGENALYDPGLGSLVPALVGPEDAATLEQFRAATAAPLTAALNALGKSRDDVLAHWVFTIHADNEALFSPTTGSLPFPNEVLQNPLVAPTEPPRPAPGILLPIEVEAGSPFEAVFAYLAGRDGFSVLDPATTTFLDDLDPNSLVAARVITEVPTAAIGFADLTDIVIQPGQALTTADLLRIQVKVPRVEFHPEWNRLEIGPRHGQPLLENRRMMIELTDELGSADGSPMRISPTFWFARSPHPLVEDGRSLVASLTDDQAVQLEQLRQAYAPMFQGFDAVGQLFPGFSRDNVVLFWTFWTQSITAELTALRAAVEATPVAAGAIEGTRRDSPTAVATNPTYQRILAEDPDRHTVRNVDEAILDGRLPPRYLLGDTNLANPAAPRYGTFPAGFDPASPAWNAGASPIPFDLFLPDRGQRTDPFELVVYVHGIGGRRQDVVRNGVLDRLLAAGYGVVTIDLPLHGQRAWSTGVPSGDGFLAPDLLALRDHIVQGAVDLHQVANAVRTGLNAFLESKLGRSGPVVRTDRIGFFGVSLGAVVGTPFVATSPLPARVVLHAAGGHFQRVVRLNEAPWFQASVRQLLCGAMGDQMPAFCAFDPAARDFVDYADIPWDDPALRQLLMILQWVLDTADPVAFAPYVSVESPFATERRVLVQAAGADDLFPPALAEELRDALQYGSAAAPTYRLYEDACHAFLAWGCDGAPPSFQSVRDQARDDAVNFLRDGTLEP